MQESRIFLPLLPTCLRAFPIRERYFVARRALPRILPRIATEDHQTSVAKFASRTKADFWNESGWLVQRA